MNKAQIISNYTHNISILHKTVMHIPALGFPNGTSLQHEIKSVTIAIPSTSTIVATVICAPATSL